MLINLNKYGYDFFQNILRPLSFIFTGLSEFLYYFMISFPTFLKLKTSKQNFHVVTACKYGSGFLSSSDMRCLMFFLSLNFLFFDIITQQNPRNMGGDSGFCPILLSYINPCTEKNLRNPEQWERRKMTTFFTGS